MGRLWVDLTTLFEEQGRHPHGTTRVERGIVASFAASGDDCGFFAFERARGGFVALAAQRVQAILSTPVRHDRGRERAGVWRRRVWGLQHRLRRLLTRKPRTAPAPADPFAPGDTVLFCGEHNRHDFARLSALKRAKRLRFAFVLFDLLHVLENGDPRLDDPTASDLPPTDFIVREASLILPISAFSAAALRGHLAMRGRAGPPIATIRLAGALADRGEGRPTAGLAPGGFVLCVGDVVQRKNHALLLRVWRRMPELPPLAIVGRIDLEGNALVGAVGADPALRDRVRFLANVDDEGLLWLYRNCRLTVFPSRLEGFGLPVAESLSFGKVCVASSAAAIPEAGQGCAISLDPDDDESWVGALRRLSDDDVLRAEAARIATSFRPVAWRDTVDDITAALAAHGLLERPRSDA